MGGFSIERFAPQHIGSASQGFASLHKQVAMFDEFLREQETGRRISYAAVVDGATVGYCNLLWESDYPPFRAHRIPEINNMHVLQAHQGRGIGRSLIAACEADACAAGLHIVGICVGLTAGYDRARSLYPRLGYVFDGRGRFEDEWDGFEALTKQLPTREAILRAD